MSTAELLRVTLASLSVLGNLPEAKHSFARMEQILDKAGAPNLTYLGGILSVPAELDEILLIIFKVSMGSVGAK